MTDWMVWRIAGRHTMNTSKKRIRDSFDSKTVVLVVLVLLPTCTTIRSITSSTHSLFDFLMMIASSKVSAVPFSIRFQAKKKVRNFLLGFCYYPCTWRNFSNAYWCLGRKHEWHHTLNTSLGRGIGSWVRKGAEFGYSCVNICCDVIHHFRSWNWNLSHSVAQFILKVHIWISKKQRWMCHKLFQTPKKEKRRQ